MAECSDGSLRGHYARQLTKEEVEHLEKDKETLTDFKKNKLEQEAKKNWDLFYKRNTTNFFKDRHWITREFPELLQSPNDLSAQKCKVLEIGCGVGNTVFPLLEENPNLFVYACDFSPKAIEFVKTHQGYSDNTCRAFVCDITKEALLDNVPTDHVDLVTMFFVLSAISPEKMKAALENILTVLKPGGRLLFRDYGLYDHAMLRFGRGHKISDSFYVRQDGTRAYYFSEEALSEVMMEAGFTVKERKYVQKETVNFKEDICVPRIFIQGRFVKPMGSSSSC